MPSQSITSDAQVVAPISATILSDAMVVAPISASILSDAMVVSPVSDTITSDVFFVEPVDSIIHSDVFFVTATTNVLTSDVFFLAPATPEFVGGVEGELCMPYLETLVEGVDYELNAESGLIKFLSSGVLGGLVNNLYVGLCGVSVDACCQDSGCVYLEDYAPGSCDGGCYVRDGYDTVFQEGAEGYRSHDEKMVKRVTVEAEPLPQSTPSPLECDIGYASQPNCFTWRPLRPLEFECQTQKSPAQHAAQRTRPDDGFHFPTWARGRYLSARFRVTGIGGGGEFSALHKMIQHWGQKDSP